MKTYIAILATLLSVGSLQANSVYRYEWVDAHPSLADFLGPYTGHIDFFEKSGTLGVGNFNAIADFSFTLHERTGEADFPLPTLPTIPPRTFTLANFESGFGTISWGKDSPFEDRLLITGSLLFRDAVQFATIEGNNLNGFWPQPYQWDQEPHEGQWVSTGKVKHGVPDTGTTFGLLLLSVGAMMIALKKSYCLGGKPLSSVRHAVFSGTSGPQDILILASSASINDSMNGLRLIEPF